MSQQKINNILYISLIFIAIFMLINKRDIKILDNTVENKLLLKIDSLTNANLILFDSIFSLKQTDTIIERQITNTTKMYETRFVYLNNNSFNTAELDSLFSNWSPK